MAVANGLMADEISYSYWVYATAASWFEGDTVHELEMLATSTA